MKNKGIKNLLIDLGGVLINLDRQRCMENFKKLGFTDVEERLNIQQLNGIFMQQEKGLITSAEFRNGMREMIGKAVSDKQIDEAWNSFLIDIPTYNWKWACENAFPYRTFKAEDYFEKTYLSYEMHLVKPESEIFKAVIEDAGIEPQETFFIDDSEMNCKAARELGISTYTPKAGEDWSHVFKNK